MNLYKNSIFCCDGMYYKITDIDWDVELELLIPNEYLLSADSVMREKFLTNTKIISIVEREWFNVREKEIKWMYKSGFGDDYIGNSMDVELYISVVKMQTLNKLKES